MGVAVLEVEGPLYAALGAELRRIVESLLNRGQRRIQLCLGGVMTVDAAGISALVRLHQMVAAANGMLRITCATNHVRVVLDRVGLLDLFNREL